MHSIDLGVSSGVPIVRLQGDVDGSACPMLERLLLDAASECSGWAVLDLLDVRYMDSAPIGTMIKVDRILDADQGALAIACRNEGLTKLFATAGLQEFMHVFADLPSAVAFVSAGQERPDGAADS